MRKLQQNVVDFGAFCEEVVKRATNYFNIERLVTTHRKLAQGTLPLAKGWSWWVVGLNRRLVGGVAM